MSRFLLAIDPGKLTGMVSVDLSTNQLNSSAEIDSWYSVCNTVENVLSEYPDTIVVIERFTISKRTIEKTRQSEPIDIIGAVKYLCLKYQGKEPVQQTATDAKNFSTNDKLHNAGFWHKGGEGHANDAARHALLYVARNNLIDAHLLLGENSDKVHTDD